MDSNTPQTETVVVTPPTETVVTPQEQQKFAEVVAPKPKGITVVVAKRVRTVKKSSKPREEKEVNLSAKERLSMIGGILKMVRRDFRCAVKNGDSEQLSEVGQMLSEAVKMTA